MILIFTIFHEQKGVKSLSFRPPTLERGLDFINFTRSAGDVIVSAHLIENEVVIELPIGIFDGASFSEPIQKLVRDWETILATTAATTDPAISTVHAQSYPVANVTMLCQERIELYLHQIELTRSHIGNVSLTLERIENMENKEVISSAGKSSPMLDHFQSQATFFKNQLNRLSCYHITLVDRMNALLGV